MAHQEEKKDEGVVDDVFTRIGVELGKTAEQITEARAFAHELVGVLFPVGHVFTEADARTTFDSIARADRITGRGTAITIPKKEFVKEHKRLINVLTKGTPDQRRAEARDQAKELKGGKKGPLHLLELFKGTGSVGKVAKRMGMNVTSVDLDPIYTPDIETDILKWDYRKWAASNPTPDLIWASPPCNTYSPLAYPLKERDTKTAAPKSDRARLGTRILYRTLEIIRYFQQKNPNLLYCIENPRGMMRNDPKMKALPHRDTTLYCLYNDKRRKPTDFWNNLEEGLGLKAPNVSACKETVGVVELPLDKRYAIPSRLVRKILTAMKTEYTALRGGAIESETLFPVNAKDKAGKDLNPVMKSQIQALVRHLNSLAHFYAYRDPATALGFRVVRDDLVRGLPQYDGNPKAAIDPGHLAAQESLAQSVLGVNRWNPHYQPPPSRREATEVTPLVAQAQLPTNPFKATPKPGKYGWTVPFSGRDDTIRFLQSRPDIKGPSLYP